MSHDRDRPPLARGAADPAGPLDTSGPTGNAAARPPEPPRPGAPRPRSPLPRATGGRSRGWRRVLWVVLATVAGLYLLGLLGNEMALRRARGDENRLQTEVADLEAQVTALHSAAATATLDAAVEAWARERRGLARPGDRVLVPVPAASQPTPTPLAAPPGSFWERLRRTFGG